MYAQLKGGYYHNNRFNLKNLEFSHNVDFLYDSTRKLNTKRTLAPITLWFFNLVQKAVLKIVSYPFTMNHEDSEYTFFE